MKGRDLEGREGRTSVWAAWAGAYAAVLLVLLATRHMASAYLAGAGVCVIACVLLLRFRPSGAFAGQAQLHAAVAVLVGVLITGGFVEERFDKIEFGWMDLAARHEGLYAADLAGRMGQEVERGRVVARLAATAAGSADTDQLFESLEVLREQTAVDALVVFTESGGLRAWAGDHRGSIPDEVRIGVTGTHFVERPLYSYLYFSSPVVGRGERAVSAVLVETGLVARSGEGELDAGRGVTDAFAARTAMRATFRAGASRDPNVVWSFAEGRDTIVHARFEAITQAELRSEIERFARLVGVSGAVVALLILSFGWQRAAGDRRSRFATALPFVAWSAALVIAPLGAVTGQERLYSPLHFLSRGGLTLGVVMAALAPIGALVATARPPMLAGRSYALGLAAGAVAVAVGYAASIRLFLDATTPLLLADESAFWIALQFAVVLLLAILTALALPRHRTPSPPRTGRWWSRHAGVVPTVAGLGVAALLGVLTLILLDRTRSTSTLLALLWAIPFLLVAVGSGLGAGRTGRLLRWLAAGWLAATAVLPHLSTAHLNARLNAATQELESLGVQTSPLLDFLLQRFGREAAEREAAGEDGLQLLYRTWVASRLAREPYGAHIMLWSTRGIPEEQLSLGGAEGSSAEAAIVWPMVRQAMEAGEPVVRPGSGLPEVSKLMAAPLRSGRAVSVSVPPRRTLEQTSAIAPFLGAATSPEVQLTLVESQEPEGPAGVIRWNRQSDGWRSEAEIPFPDGMYHAHVEVSVSSTGMRLARGVLLIALDLVLLATLWWFGNLARGNPAIAKGSLQRLFLSYRGRVTLALFAFFLVPTAMFGWVAYRALAGEVERSAQRVAEREVRQAVAEFPQPTSDLRELAARAGTDVLRFLDGELTDVSSPETLELGVYGAWMSPQVYHDLARGEETSAVEQRQLGEESFLMAYHTVRPDGVLGVPTALSAGAAAIRQRELADLILFAVLVGGILSLVLSVAVGRALTGPIGRLRRAASAVGSGHLKVRLPEPPGEFGQLFASFNRMTRRLRRARTQELRTARVLAWGEMARQIAHEIKNPLTPIKLAVQHLRRAYNDDRADFGRILDENVDQILTEIDRLTEIARAFSRYGAPGELSGPLSPVDVGAVVHEALTLYRAGDPNVRYGEDVSGELPKAQARSGELKEVILNLLENARIALDGQGHVLVRAYQTDGRIELEVRDNGPGIPAELLPRIFEPHFSTRSTGTGLGLPIVRRIVEGWG
ncbi:MAG: sensor histidine kinase, partial [Longimicrobiales bacterium]